MSENRGEPVAYSKPRHMAHVGDQDLLARDHANVVGVAAVGEFPERRCLVGQYQVRYLRQAIDAAVEQSHRDDPSLRLEAVVPHRADGEPAGSPVLMLSDPDYALAGVVAGKDVDETPVMDLLTDE